MPTTSEIVLSAIGILGVTALGLLIVPAVGWVRRQMSNGNDVQREKTTEATLDPKTIARELVVRTAGTTDNTDDGLEPPPLAQVATDPSLEARLIRIVSWAFLMAVAVFAAASGLWAENLAKIVILVAVTGEALLLIQDVLPRTPIRALRGPLQALLALVFSGVIVVPDGRLREPVHVHVPADRRGGRAARRPPDRASILAILATAAYLGAGLAVDQSPAARPRIQMLVNLDRPVPAGVHRRVGGPRAAPGAGRGDPHVDRRRPDRPVQPELLLHRPRARDRPRRPLRPGVLPGHAGPGRPQVGERPLRPHRRRPGPPKRRGHDAQRRRKIDVAARYGGDEFVALLPETDPTGGWVLAEKIRLTVAEQGMAGIDPTPTVSVGVVSYPADGRSADALLVSADRAMYASKRGGKNRVARAQAEPMVLSIEPSEGARSREGERAG